MEKLSKAWFEMTDWCRRLFGRSVWIPVYAIQYPIKHDEHPNIGYVEEVFVAKSAVIFNGNRAKAEEIDWDGWGNDNHVPFVDETNEYHAAESFFDASGNAIGFNLVLVQYVDSRQMRYVTINQDFILAYGLVQEGNNWVRPHDGYVKVIRIEKNDEDEITLVEVRSEYLKDYLAARNSALRLYCYRQRVAVLPSNPGFDWPEDRFLVNEKHNICKVYCREVGPSGDRPGTGWTHLTVRRTDVDPEEDVPSFSDMSDDNVESEASTFTTDATGDRFRVRGELWRGEWIEPAPTTCRIGDNEPEEDLYVSVDGSGRRVNLSNSEEIATVDYLWFKPDLINDALRRRGTSLGWMSAETGWLSLSPGHRVYFGMNKLGLINIQACNIEDLRLWEKRVCVAHNIPPDGKVSEELMRVQMEGKIISTPSPEGLLVDSIDFINHVFNEKFGMALVRGHDKLDELVRNLHRFRAVDDSGLHALAKDVVRFTVERFSKKCLLKALGGKESNKGAIKLLEGLLARYIGAEIARQALAPIFGVYDLRSADAHLIGSDYNINSCYERTGVNRDLASVVQGAQLLHRVALSIGRTAQTLRERVPVATE